MRSQVDGTCAHALVETRADVKVDGNRKERHVYMDMERGEKLTL